MRDGVQPERMLDRLPDEGRWSMSPKSIVYPSAWAPSPITAPIAAVISGPTQWGVKLQCPVCRYEWYGEEGEACLTCLRRAVLNAERETKTRTLPAPRHGAVGHECLDCGHEWTADERPSMRDRMLSLDDVANMPPLEPLVHGLLDLDNVALVYGRRGGAKSFLAVDLLASIATGTRWHGRLVEHGPALYVVAEGAAGIGVRFDAWLDAHGRQRPPADRLLILPEAVNLLSPGTVSQFADAAAEHGARLIVLDTLARCMVGGDENSAKDTGMAIEQLDVIRRRTGACVLVVHHAGKDSAAGARGSSALEGAADTVLEVGTTDGVMTLKCTKQKNHPEPNPVRLRLTTHGPSAVLEDYRAGTDEVTASELDTLAALAAIALTTGAASGAWEAASPVRGATFYRHRKKLVTLDLVSNVGTEKQPRYQVSEAGTLTLSRDSQP